MSKEKKRDLKLSIYPSVLQRFKLISHLKGLSLSKTLAYFISKEMLELTSNPYQLYQHYKTGKLYRIVNEIHDEIGKTFVSYHCVNEQDHFIWFQPKDSFFGMVGNKRRFAPFNPRPVKNNGSIHDTLIKSYSEYKNTVVHYELEMIYSILFNLTFSLKALLGTTTTIEQDLEERKKTGLQNYGIYLVPFNNRNAIQDAYEEHLDQLAYILQKLEEMKQSVDFKERQKKSL